MPITLNLDVLRLILDYVNNSTGEWVDEDNGSCYAIAGRRVETLKSCCLVNKEWCAIAQPHLFSRIVDDSGSADFYGIEETPLTCREWVKLIRITGDEDEDRTREGCKFGVAVDMVEALLEISFPNLADITLDGLSCYDDAGFDLAVLSRFPHLQRFTLVDSEFHASAKVKLPSLTHLAFNYCTATTHSTVQNLLLHTFPPQLKHVVIVDGGFAASGLFDRPLKKGVAAVRLLLYKLQSLVIGSSDLALSKGNPIELRFNSTFSRLLVDFAFSDFDDVPAHLSGFVKSVRLYEEKDEYEIFYSDRVFARKEKELAGQIRRFARLMETHYPLFRDLELLILPNFFADPTTHAGRLSTAVSSLLILAEARNIKLVFEDRTRETLISPAFVKLKQSAAQRGRLSEKEKADIKKDWEASVAAWQRKYGADFDNDEEDEDDSGDEDDEDDEEH